MIFQTYNYNKFFKQKWNDELVLQCLIALLGKYQNMFIWIME